MNEKRANKFSEGFTMNEVTKDQIRESVRDNYKKVALSATDNSSCCAPTSCCSPDSDVSLQFGYSIEEIKSVPAGSNFGLGCGNPQTIADLKESSC
ncbi:hypothetical protein J5TS2_24240 [Brevibacillus halotolerans]|nr:hypothetical protein J5TS2_24240 [Brevibacillus halotolerans]